MSRWSLYIDSLRDKPHAEKNRFAVMTAGVITFVIAVAWFVNFSFFAGSAKAEEPAVVTSARSPLAELKGIVNENFDRISAGWKVAERQVTDMTRVMLAGRGTTTVPVDNKIIISTTSQTN